MVSGTIFFAFFTLKEGHSFPKYPLGKTSTSILGEGILLRLPSKQKKHIMFSRASTKILENFSEKTKDRLLRKSPKVSLFIASAL